MQRVVVLLDEAAARVDDVARKVAHAEALVGAEVAPAREPRLDEEVVARVRRRRRLAEALVSCVRPLARLVEQPQQARGRLLDERDALRVVLVLDVRPTHALGRVQLLLRLEDELEKELLQLLVCKVDAELLERVCLEGLEAVDVQQSDEGRRRRLAPLGARRAIDPADGALEEARVGGLGEGVARERRPLGRQLDAGRLASRHQRARQQ
mmetsp:Transcript_18602/g.62642  ORF Transcript_18602/g.62642 Transcript_18602/m.62642 type:complete len:210 (-) Transcript_18602:1064-1693(-)